MKRIIIVQEDRVLREIVKQFVYSLGYSCAAISSIYDFDASAQEGEFDVLITDILFEDMGRLDYSIEVGKVIPYKKVLILTSMGQEKVKKRFLAMPGVKGFFGMPLDFKTLGMQLTQD